MANKIGFSDADINRELKRLGLLVENLSERDIKNAAKAALRPARKTAASQVRDSAKGSQDGYSKARFIARNIKVLPSKSGFPPGAFIRVKGPDLPVGDRKWKVGGYAKLLAYGSYKKGKRSWRSNGKNTGSVDGLGNYIGDAVRSNFNNMANLFSSRVVKEMKKAAEKVGFK